MSEADIASLLTAALSMAANEAVGAPTAIVSLEITWVAPSAGTAVTTTLTRKTRTLVFMNAELRTDAGERIVSASSVHKVLGG